MAQKTAAEAWADRVEARLHEVGEVFLGDTLDDYTWGLLCELVLPERFRAPPIDPRPLPPAAAADPAARAVAMARRHARGFALHSPADPPKPPDADGGRGLEPAGPGLTAKQAAVRPASHRRTRPPGVR